MRSNVIIASIQTPSNRQSCISAHSLTVPVPTDQRNRGCCWKAFHTDINGKWWKPHKAGPVMAVLLVIGWILFIVLFGWIVLMALILVAILICFSYCCNFICTGKCQPEEEDEQEQTHITSGVRGGVSSPSRMEAGHAYPPTSQNANRNRRQ